MKNLFTIDLQSGNWKWWFSLIVLVASIFLFDAKSWIVISIIIPILLSLKISNSNQGLVTTNFKKTLFIGFLSFLIFTVLVYFFESLSEEASEASKKVMNEFGFGETLEEDWYMVLLLCFWAPLGEEFLYRGVFFRSIFNSISLSKKIGKYKKLIGFVIASVISSFLFMSVHGGEGQDNQLVMIFILGVLTSASYYITGSLYAPVLLHALNNSYVIYNSSSNFLDSNMRYYIMLMPIAVCVVLFVIQQILRPLEKINLKSAFKKY